MATSEPRRVVAPEPPAGLGQIALPLAASVQTTWFRLSQRRHLSPLFWSRLGRYRFDSAYAKWGVCYTAASIQSAFQEVFGDRLRERSALDWSDLEGVCVWSINTPRNLRVLNLFGETLTVTGSNVQCFVSSYPRSQRWGAAFMDHPSDLDGLVYIGRRCGDHCLAMFGDADSPRAYQSQIQPAMMGALCDWTGFWPMLDRLNVRIRSIPKTLDQGRKWSLKDE